MFSMSTVPLSETAPVWANPGRTLSDRGAPSDAAYPTLAGIWMRAGQVPLDRILMKPEPGTATEDDAADSRHKLNLNCELVNGILVAKTMGWYESQVALALGYFLHQYLDKHPIGVIAGEDGPCRTVAFNIRKPDVAFVSLDRFPERKLPRRKVLPIAPDLAVEILSEGNTTAEMDLKLKEYFAAGVKAVWYVEPDLRSVRVFTAADKHDDIAPDGVLRGGDVLPGFELSLTKLFEKVGPRMEE
jgi:Uma2 family endonuclease